MSSRRATASLTAVTAVVLGGLALGPAAPASAEQHTFGGTVTMPNGTTPIEDAVVTLFRAYGDGGVGVVATTYADEDGHYSFTAEDDGLYTLRFSAAPSTDWITQWLGGGVSEYDPATIYFGADTTTSFTTRMELGGRIDGVVRATDGSIAGGVGPVNAYRSDGQGGFGFYAGGTYFNGGFSIRSLPPGSYRLHFAGDDGEWYDNASDAASATPLTVTAGQLTPTSIVLGVPEVRGVLSDGTNPIGGVTVELKETENFETITSDTTDAQGRFEFVDVEPGEYTLLKLADGTYDTWWLGPEGFGDLADTFEVERDADVAIDFEVPPLVQPTPSDTPRIVGTPMVGRAVSVREGDWPAGTHFEYRWFANDVPIDGATGERFTPTVALLDYRLRVDVTGTADGYGPSVESSIASDPVAKGRLKASQVPTPKLSGTAKVGKKLTAKPGDWPNGWKLSYRWFEGSKRIQGESAKTLRLTKSLKGAKVSVEVTGAKAGWMNASESSKRVTVK